MHSFHLICPLTLVTVLLACGQTPTQDAVLFTAAITNADDGLLESDDPVQSTTAHTDTLNSGLLFRTSGTYSEARAVVTSELAALQHRELSDSLLQLANAVFTQQLLNMIIPHWYGTTWDFNGHTAIPNEGEIACGYFVSTTLQHMGLKLNRYHMAQQSALGEAKTIALGEEVKMIYPSATEIETLEFAHDMTDGLYLVGLSNHVGYFLLVGGSGYFIHSDYVSGQVRFENAASSEAFKSDILCFAPISSNEKLMKKWLKGEEVVVVMD